MKMRLEAAGACSAELHSAVSPNFIRQSVQHGWRAESKSALQIANLRYSTVQLCATSGLAMAVVFLCSVLAAPAQNEPATSPQFFAKSIHPLLTEYCLKCHSTEKHKGDLDLELFSSLGEVKKHPKIWQTVVEQLSNNEMPPKDKPQPTAAQREQLLNWVNAVLDEVALARAGDPGPVVLRRLSNAEYTYTLRDLTGVASLDPAREFPTDSASGEGFMNVGNSLVMSPSLVTKYLDAGKEIANHAVLLPDGIRFSPKNTRRDWTEELLAEIRGTYREFTDNGSGTSVNLQGIRFDTKDGGVLPLDKYLAALLEERAGTKKPATLPAGLSAKYLKTLRDTLNSTQPNFLLDPIRARWRSAKPGDAPALAKEISQWQHALWKFNSVGHIGKKNGPGAWMEPLAPIQSKQELRFKIPASSEAKEITLYLRRGGEILCGAAEHSLPARGKIASHFTHIAQQQCRLARGNEPGLFPNHVIVRVAIAGIRRAEVKRDLLRLR